MIKSVILTYLINKVSVEAKVNIAPSSEAESEVNIYKLLQLQVAKRKRL